MPESEAELCNIALARIGQGEFIDALTEDTREARACKVCYSHCRDTVLASHPWSFATKRSTLALLTVERTGWEFAYALPTDCITALSLYSGTRAPSADVRVPFAIEHDSSSNRVLLTDEEEAELIYIGRVTAPPLFPPLFTDALAWKLASELALSLPVKPGVAVSLEQAYGRALARAGAADFRQAQEDLAPDSEFIRIR